MVDFCFVLNFIIWVCYYPEKIETLPVITDDTIPKMLQFHNLMANIKHFRTIEILMKSV